MTSNSAVVPPTVNRSWYAALSKFARQNGSLWQTCIESASNVRIEEIADTEYLTFIVHVDIDILAVHVKALEGSPEVHVGHTLVTCPVTRHNEMTQTKFSK